MIFIQDIACESREGENIVYLRLINPSILNQCLKVKKWRIQGLLAHRLKFGATIQCVMSYVLKKEEMHKEYTL